ncbi:hypothetical protein AAAC51_13790 [Priestia megaterium]
MYLTGVLLAAGVWYGTAQPGGSKAVVKWFPSHHRGLAMGIRQTGIPIEALSLQQHYRCCFINTDGMGLFSYRQRQLSEEAFFFVFYREQSSSSEKGNIYTSSKNQAHFSR